MESFGKSMSVRVLSLICPSLVVCGLFFILFSFYWIIAELRPQLYEITDLRYRMDDISSEIVADKNYYDASVQISSEITSVVEAFKPVSDMSNFSKSFSGNSTWIPVLSFELYQFSLMVTELENDLLSLSATTGNLLYILSQFEKLNIESMNEFLNKDSFMQAEKLGDISRNEKKSLVKFNESHEFLTTFSIIYWLSGYENYKKEYRLEVIELTEFVFLTSSFLELGLDIFDFVHKVQDDLDKKNAQDFIFKNETIFQSRVGSVSDSLSDLLISLDEIGPFVGQLSLLNRDVKMASAGLDVFSSMISLLESFDYSYESREGQKSNSDPNERYNDELTSIDPIQIPLMVNKIADFESGLVELKEKIIRFESDFKNYESHVLDENYFDDFDIGGWLHLIHGVAAYLVDLSKRDGNASYLVLGHSSDELRASGGFVSALWVINITNWEVKDIDYYDILEVDNIEDILEYPTPSSDLQEHMGAWVLLMRDASWELDFEENAEQAIDLFSLEYGDHILHGAIGVNQWGLYEIVNSMDKSQYKMENPSALLSPIDLISSLEKGTDLQGRIYVDGVLKRIIEQLREYDDIVDIVRVANAFKTGVQQKDIMSYFEDSAVQNIVAGFDISGNVEFDSNNNKSDYIYIVDSNVGWSKSDRNMERSVEYTVDFREPNNISSTLALNYINHSGDSAAKCEPQWVHRGDTYQQLKNACYWNFLRVLIPRKSHIIAFSEQPIPEYSMAVENNFLLKGENTSSVAVRDTLVFSTIDVTEAGNSSDIFLSYELPNGILDILGDDKYRYNLLIQKQSGVRDRKFSLNFKLADNMTITDSSHALIQSDKLYSLSVDANKDIELFLTIEIND